MLLKPKNLKYEKTQKNRLNLKVSKVKNLTRGSLGLKSLESAYLKANQLEAIRQTISRHLQRQGRVSLIVFPNLGITTKSLGIRIGKGKGSLDHWVYRLSAGQMIFEVDGVDEEIVEEALNSASHKLRFKLKCVSQAK